MQLHSFSTNSSFQYVSASYWRPYTLRRRQGFEHFIDSFWRDSSATWRDSTVDILSISLHHLAQRPPNVHTPLRAHTKIRARIPEAGRTKQNKPTGSSGEAGIDTAIPKRSGENLSR